MTEFQTETMAGAAHGEAGGLENQDARRCRDLRGGGATRVGGGGQMRRGGMVGGGGGTPEDELSAQGSPPSVERMMPGLGIWME